MQVLQKMLKNQQLFMNLYVGIIIDVKKINYYTYMQVL
jgi:hypothetical protein